MFLNILLSIHLIHRSSQYVPVNLFTCPTSEMRAQLSSSHIQFSFHQLVGHAFGSVNNVTYTNSLEAFKESYSRGIRLMEIDLLLTSDSKVVLAHDWSRIQPQTLHPTQEQFKKSSILGSYSPLLFSDLIQLMIDYPDIYIITDSKYSDKARVETEFREMIRVIREFNATSLLSRFVIQIYDEEMYDYVRGIYPFETIAFTLYQRWHTKNMKDFRQICEWASTHNITAIVMWADKYAADVALMLRQYCLPAWLHSVNDPVEAATLLRCGAEKIYTDSLPALATVSPSPSPFTRNPWLTISSR